MAELTTGAERALKRHMGQIEKRLKRTGFAREEIDAASAGVNEQVHAVLDAKETGAVDEATLAAVLQDIEQPDDWVVDQGPVAGRGLGMLGLAVALLTLLGLLLAGVFQDFIGGDSGAVMSTIGIFGFLTATVVGFIGRRALAGRAAIILSVIFVGLFLFAWAAAVLIG